MKRAPAILLAGLLVTACLPAGLEAQHVSVTGYGLNVVVGSAAGPLTEAAAQNAARLRVMGVAVAGPWRLDLAYEHDLTLSSRAGATGLAALVGTGGGGDFLPLQGTLDRTSHAVWRHRLDRASAELRTDRVAAAVGRQTISWATTLLLTPADPFVPFDPADPFRDYRPGVDAARLRLFVGTMGELDAAVRLAVYGPDTTVTALGRGRTTVGRTDLSAWGGLLHDEPALAIGITTIAADAALRLEATLRLDQPETVVRVAAGVDRSFTVARRTLYAGVEYQYDEFGASSADDLTRVLASPAVARGELQVLGRHEVAAQASYQVHPLAQLGLLGIANLGDPSLLLTPSIAWDATRAVGLRLGGFAGFGSEPAADGLGSEYGLVPLTGYVAGTVYF